MSRHAYAALAVLFGLLVPTEVVQGSCQDAAHWLAASCQQFRAAVGSFPELTSQDNATIEVPINPVRIHGWYMQGKTDCQGNHDLYFCRCCFAYANFLAQSCRCSSQSAPVMAAAGITDEEFQSVTIAAAIACEKHGNVPLLDPQHGAVCQNGLVQS